jgi:glycosyltransferase involved in cell wall biosynthesis
MWSPRATLGAAEHPRGDATLPAVVDAFAGSSAEARRLASLPVRILMLHNRYRAPGGEERAVANLVEMLSRHGHAVSLLERSSAELGRLQAAAAMTAGGLQAGSVARAVAEFDADVVHAHNLHPLFGWRALQAAGAAGAAVVLHLHNLRLFCAVAIGYRAGHPCFECRGRNTLPGVAHRCRGSVAESATYAAGLSRAQPGLLAYADRFITVSQFTAGKLMDSGLPGRFTDVLPNFIPDDDHATRSGAADGAYGLASGRLVPEKGFDTAIVAARASKVPLVIAGDGPEAPRLAALADGADVRLLGRVTPQRLAELRRAAAFVLVPSRCDDACPYAATEALADGVPVIGSTRGGLPELLEGQLTLDADDVDQWASQMSRLWRDPMARSELGASALETARALLSEERYHDQLLRIYAQARVNRRPATGD